MSSRPLPPPGFVAARIRRGRYIFLKPPDREPLALVCAGYEVCEPDFFVDRPSFQWHAVEFLESGSWDVRQEERWVSAAAGTIVVYGPNQAGGIRAAGRGPHGKYSAELDPTYEDLWHEKGQIGKTVVTLCHHLRAHSQAPD